MRLLRMTAALVAALLCLAVGTASAGASLPVIYNFQTAIAASLVNPGGSPAGANEWGCKPSAAHPRPVVLVPGTFANMIDSFNALSPLLKNNGYCVFTLDYGGLFAGQIGAYGPVAASAGELKTFVEKVRSNTGAAKVDIVGWSQGGMMPRYYLKNLGGAANVNALVGLAPSNHGTTLDGIATLAGYFPGAITVLESFCQACTDQLAGSSFLTSLNAGGDTVAGVTYTVIESKYDEVVTPYTSAFLSGASVTNTTLQNQCVLDLGDHLSMPYDHIADQDVLNALDPAHAKGSICSPILPGIGG
jgi:triacylglycerol esterase/lipase EstA (alpha/beta hydrolase family)